MELPENVKIAVIGGGPAGKYCSTELAKKGFSVSLYEKNKIGGTCLNYGCTYITGLREMADIINNLNIINSNKEIKDDIKYSIKNKIKLEDIISFKELQKNISNIQNKIREKLERDILEYNNIKLYNKEFKEEYKKNYDYIVYATGKKYTNNYNGVECLIHSDIVNMEELPEKILIIGGGTVAMEYASLFSNYGCEVVVFVRSKFLKMIEDKDIRNYILKFITFKIINDENQLNELLNDNRYTKILAIGGKGTIKTDDNLKVMGKDNEYACGDCVIGKGGTTPISRMEGKVVAENIYNELNNKPLIKPNYNNVPNTIRLDLNISYVGKQTNDFKIIPNSVGKGDFFRVFHHIGINKIYYENNKVVGAISMSPSIEIIPYFAQYLNGVKIYDGFMEVHPSTDPFYKIFGNS